MTAKKNSVPNVPKVNNVAQQQNCLKVTRRLRVYSYETPAYFVTTVLTLNKLEEIRTAGQVYHYPPLNYGMCHAYRMIKPKNPSLAPIIINMNYRAPNTNNGYASNT